MSLKEDILQIVERKFGGSFNAVLTDAKNRLSEIKMMIKIDLSFDPANWSLVDIIAKASEVGIPLTTDEARKIARTLELDHDCEIGCNWESIEYAVRQFSIDRDRAEQGF